MEIGDAYVWRDTYSPYKDNGLKLLTLLHNYRENLLIYYQIIQINSD